LRIFRSSFDLNHCLEWDKLVINELIQLQTVV